MKKDQDVLREFYINMKYLEKNKTFIQRFCNYFRKLFNIK